MAEESLTKGEDVLTEGESGEEFLRHEEEEQPEIVELPPNIQNMQVKMDRLRSEITALQGQFNDVQAELDTRLAAFNWYNDQLQAALEEQMDIMEIVGYVTMIVTVASLVAAQTPTPKDDVWIGKLYKLIDLLAINVGKSKQKSGES